MNTRRKFLLQGSMATTALLVTKPFKSIANALAPVTGYKMNENKLIFLHTSDHTSNNKQQIIQQVNNLKKNHENVLLLHAGDLNGKNTPQLKYDVAMPSVSEEKNYQIIYKGEIKIGIINIKAVEKATIKNINALSKTLKEEKNCQVVVCLSQLGFKNKTTVDDVKLAKSSTCIDVIIGGHPVNFSTYPFTAQNRKKEEVIIHSASENGFALGNIEISFDESHKKNSIAFNNLLTRLTASN